MTYFIKTSKKKEKGIVFCVTSAIIFCTLLFSGCTQQPTKEQGVTPPTQNKGREDYRVTLSVYTDNPFDTNTPTRVIGYGGIYAENLIRTAKHLLTDTISRLVITNHAGVSCPIQQIWMHDHKDIALIQTSRSCVRGIAKNTLLDSVYPKEVLYIDNILKKTSLLDNQEGIVVIDKKLSPGMSGSPLFLADRTIIGVVSAQTTSGTEVIVINKTLLSTRPAVEKIISGI